MGLYYLPCLVRSDRYYIARLEPGLRDQPDFNFVINAADRVLTPLLTIEDPQRIVLNQMAPTGQQDIPLNECHLSMHRTSKGYELKIRKNNGLRVDAYHDEETGIRLDHLSEQKRIILGIYNYKVVHFPLTLTIKLEDENNCWYGELQFTIVPVTSCNRVVIDFGSEASQIGYKHCGHSSQSAVQQYDILENIMAGLQLKDPQTNYQRNDFLNLEPGQPMLYRSFYAIKNKISAENAENFPFNFTDDLGNDEIRLFITRQEVAATTHAFSDNYQIVPNLKLGIEKSLQLQIGDRTEDYSIRSHKKELIAAILLRMLRLMISTKPAFREGGIIVTLLVPNIYTQHDVFELLNELRYRTEALLRSLQITVSALSIEYETISESDAAFMGYQQTHGEESALSNGQIALVIDCGKGTTDISMLLADENENYSSFFRTGFAGAGNVLSYAFVEDFLSLVLKAIPGHNEISVKQFISDQMLRQHLTTDVLNFIQLMEDQKKRFSTLQPVSVPAFAEVTENVISSERTIGTLYKDPATLLQYADEILKNRNIRWDDEVTGMINKAAECICHSIIASIREVMTKDIRKRIKLVMLSGRAFYFERLKTKLEKALSGLLGEDIRIQTVPQGRTLNNKNVALYGAFSGAYKITDFTGIPIDKKEGLSGNKDVLDNNMYLYRGIKIQPGNDIIYNSALVRRNNQELKGFRNKSLDIYFTRDNIYLRMMENQKVKDVRSFYTVLQPLSESWSSAQDLRAISMFPDHHSELASINAVHEDIRTSQMAVKKKNKKKNPILQFFQFGLAGSLFLFSSNTNAQQLPKADSLDKLYAPIHYGLLQAGNVKESNEDLSLLWLGIAVIAAMGGFITIQTIQHRKLLKAVRSLSENKNGTLSYKKIDEMNAELMKLLKENEGLNRVIKEYNGIQHEFDSLKHGLKKTYKVKNYPGNERSKDELAAMQAVLSTEKAVAGYAYEKFLKPLLGIADTYKNNPSKMKESDRLRIIDLLISLSFLYIEYLYLRVSELSVGGNIVQRINACSKGMDPDPSLLKKLNKEFGSRALVMHLALQRSSLTNLSYPVFDETNLNEP